MKKKNPGRKILDSYIIKITKTKRPQSEKQTSFIGGVPCLPAGCGIPRCKLCRSELTFFFQVAFPQSGSWQGLSLAVFACTSCDSDKYCIPEMLDGPLNNIDIPEGFLVKYQRNFRLLVFKTEAAVMRTTYEEKIIYKAIGLVPTINRREDQNKLGGDPVWLQNPEFPKSYNKKVKMFFIMQLMNDVYFNINESALEQKGLQFESVSKKSKISHYRLFLANKLYFFGTDSNEDHQVYVVTQID